MLGVGLDLTLDVDSIYTQAASNVSPRAGNAVHCYNLELPWCILSVRDSPVQKYVSCVQESMLH